MNTLLNTTTKLSTYLIAIAISMICNLEVKGQFFQDDQFTFLKVLEYDSTAIEKLSPSRAKGLYYVQDTFADQLVPLATIYGKTTGVRHHRLDNQFEKISEQALRLGLNSIRVDSSKIDLITCEYWISLYRMKLDQIKINESIVGDNLLVVFGKFDDYYKKGNSFKINGRKIQLMPFEYVQRNIAHGKRGSVNFNNTRLELLGGEKGGELFINSSKNPFTSASLNLTVGASFGALGMLVSIPLSSKNKKNSNGIKRNFAHFLYNIYNEKIVIAKTREDIVAAKRKEWREKKRVKEAKKKAKEEKKKKG